MKRSFHILFLSTVAAVLFACSGQHHEAQPGQRASGDTAVKIKIKGSETVRPIIEKIDDNYMALHPNVFVDYTGGGSNIGLMSFMANEADVIFVSREITPEEHEKLKSKGALIDTFAIDGLAVIVNLLNPVKTLSLQQLSDIYAGKTKNWNAVGGENWPIVLYSRDISSGTYSFFKNKVLDSLDYAKDDINLIHNEEIINNVSNTKNAIGYVGLSYTNRPNIKTVSLIFKNGEKPLAPNFQNIGSNAYHLKRYLLLIHRAGEKEEVANFIRILKEDQSLRIINELGLIPVKSML